ncbi:hypothetical protein [Oerskovia sp. KBS0722]|uniref:hypothetical protein n=1 Tax=Oerskovia sp. KBS0722 TaxID=1179673 RepID=UPI00110D9DA7|nr:hypothetical protein [Oerskovia sp. KBS0722]QDW61576.1 hypothetical protein FFI11_002720 [Oerskovia sp. KBS0722]
MVVVGGVGGSLLAVGLTWPSPQPVLSVGLLALALPVCAIIVRWSLASHHVTVRGARLVATDDDRGWLVVRRPLGGVLLDGSRLGAQGVSGARGSQRALADRAVTAYATGRAERVEMLRLLDRIVALDRLERGAEGLGAWGRSPFTPEQRSLLSRHVLDAVQRDVELLEARRAGLTNRVLRPTATEALP